MPLEEQRAAVKALYKELALNREAINQEITKIRYDFFVGKEVVIRHSRGEFDAEVRKTYSDGTCAVVNLEPG